MPEIAKISVQKKDKHRYNIFLKENGQDVYAFSVAEDLLIEHHLRKGLTISDELIEQLKEKDSFYKVYTLSLRYLSYRMRSEKEIIDYLHQKEVDIETIKAVVQRLKQEKWLDDLAFAESFVRTRLQMAVKGPLLIRKELADKGVSNESIEQALIQYPFEDQMEKIDKWLNKQNQMSSKKSYKQQLENLKQRLMQKGFTQDAIQEALQQHSFEKDPNEEYQAVVYQGEKLIQKYKRKAAGSQLRQKVTAALYRKGFSFDVIEPFLDEYLDESANEHDINW
ncbi:hypothetical protein J416_14397 [Gracilibacillus halophilus YIM-C55.5]|uniref:Regulatory protein RecX n=1 Tax=Gracilibacillus halophilus YIM-C55.5 TaxID=1308866 RepID=N4WRC1_9BACI|nr:hypothetical protein J416_14397 [Gracilibacillus halophilus YIM-C55.5]